MARRDGRHCTAPTACVPRALRNRDWKAEAAKAKADKAAAAKAAAAKAAADKAAADKAAADKAAAEKAAATKAAAEKAAAEKAAAEKAAAEKAAAEKAAAEKAAAEKAAADKAAADKAAADKAAAEKAAAEKAAAEKVAAEKVAAEKRAAAERAAAERAAAEKVAAEKRAADKATAEKAAVERAAAERAAADKAAAEELRRRATALGLLQVLTTANIADDVTLKKSIAFCDEQGVTSVSDLVEYNLVDDFVRHLGLKHVPGMKLRGMLQAPTSGLAGHLSDRLTSPSSPSLQQAAASMINQGAPWDFFMSHKQGESGPDMALITMDLLKAGKRVWLDKNMKDCSTAAMMEGVEHSKTFVLVLSNGYFDSTFCVMELRRAIELRKKIVLCHKQGVNVGAILQRKPSDPEFASIGDKQSLELVTSDAVYREFAVQRLIASAADGVAPNFGFPFWW